jgi:hypothetical protein
MGSVDDVLTEDQRRYLTAELGGGPRGSGPVAAHSFCNHEAIGTRPEYIC